MESSEPFRALLIIYILIYMTSQFEPICLLVFESNNPRSNSFLSITSRLTQSGALVHEKA